MHFISNTESIYLINNDLILINAILFILKLMQIAETVKYLCV